eukprot:8659535-Alexandrium_andersonii.AAC.2
MEGLEKSARPDLPPSVLEIGQHTTATLDDLHGVLGHPLWLGPFTLMRARHSLARSSGSNGHPASRIGG